MTTKKCTKCGIEKPLTEFDKDKSKKDGHASNCKSCKANWRANNKEKLKQVKFFSKYTVMNCRSDNDASEADDFTHLLFKRNFF